MARLLNGAVVFLHGNTSLGGGLGFGVWLVWFSIVMMPMIFIISMILFACADGPHAAAAAADDPKKQKQKRNAALDPKSQNQSTIPSTATYLNYLQLNNYPDQHKDRAHHHIAPVPHNHHYHHHHGMGMDMGFNHGHHSHH